MNTNSETQHKQKLVDEASAKLMDEGAFDGLVLIASWQTEDGLTAAVQSPRGNWYIQNGLAEFFLVKRNERGRMEARDQETKDAP